MNSKPIDKNLQTFIHGWSGAIAGAISTLLLYPMENLKTRMQTKREGMHLIQVAQAVIEKEGLLSLYKGMTPMMLGNFISYGIYFYWYQLFKEVLAISHGDTLGTLKVSFLSGVITTIGTNPFWVIQTRSVVEHASNSFLCILQKMLKNEGFRSLFKGLSASLILVINPIIQFITYEFLKDKLAAYFPSKFLLFFICGAISKAIATVITFPYQVIRTFKHIEEGQTHRSLIQIIQDILKKDGPHGFFVGLSPKLIQTVLNSAFILTFYESIVKIVESHATRMVPQATKLG